MRYLSRADLRREGWTLGEIKQLGEPDLIVANPHGPALPYMWLWRADTVARVADNLNKLWLPPDMAQ